MELIIFLKDGSQRKISLMGLQASGIKENNFFIENKKEGRLEIPLDSIDGFKIEKEIVLIHELNMTILLTAVGLLSKHMV
ncbi:MAG: hypothetical protein ACFFCV_04880 [Promethearchaeota archaeon]